MRKGISEPRRWSAARACVAWRRQLTWRALLLQFPMLERRSRHRSAGVLLSLPHTAESWGEGSNISVSAASPHPAPLPQDGRCTMAMSRTASCPPNRLYFPPTSPFCSGAQPDIQQRPDDIGTAQLQLGLSGLHPGSVGIQAAEQLFRYSEGKDARVGHAAGAWGVPAVARVWLAVVRS
jgi:hypothetical protein